MRTVNDAEWIVRRFRLGKITVFRDHLILSCFLLLTAVVLPARGSDWPMWRCNPERIAETADGLPNALVRSWVLELPSPQPAWPTTQDKLQFDVAYEPIVADGKIFVGSMTSDHITAYDVDTGKEVWRFYTDGPVRFAPAAANGKVYAGSDDGHLYCLRADTGELVWKLQGGPANRRVLGNGRLISTWPVRGGVVVRDGTVYWTAGVWPFMGIFLYAVDGETGRVIWSNSGSGSTYTTQQHNSEAFSGVAPQGCLVVADDTLLVPGGRTVPAAYDLKRGGLLYYAPSDRTFGNFSGGHDVTRCGAYYINNGAMYRLKDGEPLLTTPANALVTRTALLNIEDNHLRAYGLEPRSETHTDRKGRKVTEYVLPELWKSPLTVPLKRLCIKAGENVYGYGKDGLIAAVRLPRQNGSISVDWQTKLESTAGAVHNMIAADDKLFVTTDKGRIYCFADEEKKAASSNNARSASPTTAKSADGKSQGGDGDDVARSILEASGIKEGYALLLDVRDEVLISALARQSELHIVGQVRDKKQLTSLRRKLDKSGLYGPRVALLAGSLEDLELPPYFASLIVSGSSSASCTTKTDFVRRLFDSLRPYGGRICLKGLEGDAKGQIASGIDSNQGRVTTQGDWTLIERIGPPPGSADWTHQYADAANTVISKDEAVKAPLGLLWFGGSSNAKILPRHGHGPTPQVVGGRLFIEGPDILRAMDIYTGRVLWDKDLPGIGQDYDNTSHEPGANSIGSNYVSLADGIYVNYGTKCLKLDPATGATLAEFTLPPLPDTTDLPEWGYLAAYNEDLLIATARPLSFWEPDFETREFAKTPDKRLKELAAAIGGWGTAHQPAFSDFKGIVAGLNAMLRRPEAFAVVAGTMGNKRSRDAKWQKAFDRLGRQIRDHLQAEGGDDSIRLRELNRRMLELCYDLPAKPKPKPGQGGLEHIASQRLVVMNRHSGKVLWTWDADFAIRHNAIAVGDGKVFCIDRLPDPVIDRKLRRGETIEQKKRLIAFDVRTGNVVWSTDKHIFGTWLSYSKEYDVLVQAHSRSRDRAKDEPDRNMAVYQADDGKVVWESDVKYSGPVMLHHDTIITQGTAMGLLTGEPKMEAHPITGEPTRWKFIRNYGCNTTIGSEHLLTFRSAAAGFFDLSCDGGTANLGGFKSGCTSNLIVAGGVLSAPDYTRTCTCSYQNQTSLAFVHDPDVEVWTFDAYPSEPEVVRQVGLNLGAPGDRKDGDGTLWLDYPSVGGPSPDIGVRIAPENVVRFRKHASEIQNGVLHWVEASGLRGLRRIVLQLGSEENKARRYQVRLHFAEPDRVEAGERVFDVSIQGKPCLKALDIAGEAQGSNRGIVKTFDGIEVADKLEITLTPSVDARLKETILCGIKVQVENH